MRDQVRGVGVFGTHMHKGISPIGAGLIQSQKVNVVCVCR